MPAPEQVRPPLAEPQTSNSGTTAGKVDLDLDIDLTGFGFKLDLIDIAVALVCFEWMFVKHDEFLPEKGFRQVNGSQ